MEELKPTTQGIFPSFGLGSLFVAMILLLLGPEKIANLSDYDLKNLDLPDALWLPIGAIFTFLLYTLGRFVAYIGKLFGHFFKLSGFHSNKLYAELVCLENEWLWKRYQQQEQSDSLVWGILGICLTLLIVFGIGVGRRFIGLEGSLPFSWSAAYFLATAIFMLLGALKVSQLELEHLILTFHHTTIKGKVGLRRVDDNSLIGPLSSTAVVIPTDQQK
ncbi:MAG: hypothetical protein ABI832_24090 [bacterium]